jgi:hypothetical protein
MKAIEIVESLKGKAGQHVSVVWQRAAKVVKSCPFLIVKRTAAWVRSGINYTNLQSVRDAIEAGTREAVEGLPWGQWREGFANYIIDHKDKEYVRLYPASFDNLSHPQVEWLVDGKPATYAQVEQYLLASEKHKEEDKPACFTVNTENVLSVGS